MKSLSDLHEYLAQSIAKATTVLEANGELSEYDKGNADVALAITEGKR